MGISTSGAGGNKPFHMKDNNSLTTEQLKEYGQLNPFNLGVMPDRTKVMDKIPTIEIKQIKDYLTVTKVLTAAQAKTYRVTQDIDLTSMVRNVYFSALFDFSPTYCALRGQCLPSFSTSDEEVKAIYVILDKITGEPYGGYCTCTAG